MEEKILKKGIGVKKRHVLSSENRWEMERNQQRMKMAVKPISGASPCFVSYPGRRRGENKREAEIKRLKAGWKF